MTPPEPPVTLEVSTTQIANYAQFRDAVMHPQRVPPDALPEEIRARADELFQLGFKTMAVARRIGVQPKMLRAIMEDESRSTTVERRRQVSNLVAEGLHFNEILARLGVAEWIIRSDLKALRISPSPTTCRAQEMNQRKEDVLRLHQRGKAVHEIAHDLKLSITQVRYALNRAGMDWHGVPKISRHAGDSETTGMPLYAH